VVLYAVAALFGGGARATADRIGVVVTGPGRTLIVLDGVGLIVLDGVGLIVLDGVGLIVVDNVGLFTDDVGLGVSEKVPVGVDVTAVFCIGTSL